MKKPSCNPFGALGRAALALAFAATLLPVPAFAEPDSAADPAGTGSSASVGTLQPLGRMVETERGPVFSLNDPSLLNPASGANALAALPDSYDLRTAGAGGASLSTSVKDQYPFGDCWSFGALSSLESNLLVTDHATGAPSSPDLAERHLAWFAYNGADDSADDSRWAGGDTFLNTTGRSDYDAGGARNLSAATLMRWYGAVDEQKAPYINDASMGAPDAALRNQSDVHVQNVMFLPEPNVYTWQEHEGGSPTLEHRRDPSAVDAIKTCLMENGVVDVSFYADNAITNNMTGRGTWNPATSAYFYSKTADNAEMLANHEVSIIGWDDSFPKEKFSTQPEGDGAWIVKNSWGSGTSGHQDGCFYLSYYDTSFSNPTSYQAEQATYDADGTDHAYDGIYQYDGVGVGETGFSNTQRIQFANVFEARGSETVQAVSVFLPTACSQVDITVYRNPTGLTDGGTLNPQSGTLKWHTTLTGANAGYTTIDLGSDAFPVIAGDTFSVVASAQEPNGNYLMLAEVDDASQEYAAIDCAAGQTYYTEGTSDWHDMARENLFEDGAGYTAGNALLKAYTTETPAGPDTPIAILHTNDVHCGVDQTFDEDGTATSIGYAGVSQALKDAEAAYGADNVTLVDAGDAVQGKPLGTLSQGADLVDIMNQVGYDLAIPGNHEFDYGMDQLRRLVDRSNATYLSCNFDNLETGATEFSPYTIETYGNVRVAYVGISTPESLTKSNPAHFKDASGTDVYGFCEDETGQMLYDRVQQTVDEAHANGADYVVALGHLGQSGVAARWRSDTVIANTTGIDVFIDGHSHEQYEQRVANKAGRDVLLAQTGTQLQTYGEVIIHPTTGKIETRLVKPPVAQDPDTAAFIKDIEDRLSKTLDKVVARTEVKLVAVESDTQHSWAVRMRETNLGDLAADAVRASLGADIGFMNGGGIRSDVAVGDITYGDAIAVLPFGNTLCKVEATGQTIVDALEMGARLYPEPNGGLLQTSGLTYEIRSDIPSPVKLDEKGVFVGIEGARRVQNVRVGGEPIDLGKTYTVSSITYLLQDSGDGFSMFKDAKVLVSEQGLDYEALISFIKDDLSGVIRADSIYADENGTGRILVKTGAAVEPEPIPQPQPTPNATEGGATPKPLARTGDTAAPTAAATSALALSALTCAAIATRAVRRRRRTAAETL
ncbi:5'-nucleotidase C-terminal domain-containing protein [Enteroscipio rubneri]|uniref:Peptidase C1A papain C-terminal domain-containing protein n=1 Tax=Enteroscipio rubneri TaxID=2070686 RepID=A0A2K2UA70_9ACTN|nr:5'-nucleotidase C-terminal domain-containing protein [Enteroscipio rubneri]PNV67216.1 hypothetical protein C2L71_09040 [Enteroscipio rubneri]